MTAKCTKCKGENVRCLCWVDVNTEEIKEGYDPAGYYCPDCDTHDVEIYFQHDFKPKTNNHENNNN